MALGIVAGLVLSTAATAVAASGIQPQAVPIASITDQARATLSEARVAVAAADVVVDDVTASGLVLDTADTTIDTADLVAAIDDLATIEVMPLFLLPDVVETAADETAEVVAETQALRGALDTAVAEKKAAEEAAAAAEQARLEAEAAAAALAAANTVEGAQATAARMAAERGWGSGELSCLVSLWNRESGWDYQAYNDLSGATGIPQSLPGDKMASAGADWQTNATTQIIWGLDYIARGYGSPCGAWGHSQATGWY
ncbi:hypothetical protein SAMN05880545_0190 [Microbacterium sp. RU33B]|nr:hypothetical protein SAMN05880545_0190 [Microbacterium sp. RU33B]